ncbi:hypothetical protein CSAL01_04560 [Colletotrichum salicis]|uniref:Uncharacterized protein n=1 Tax=Colletotrichum salicis TaxID=1209931 RepID=A0A135USR9_9PEZI|nr:hypothetical protein CSAL01_04560 [Colletotrichum salicis]
MLPLILDSTRRGWTKGAILVSLFLFHTSTWVLCTNNAQADYYHNEVVFDACPQNHPSQIVVGAAMFTMAAMVWMPPLFGIYLSVVLCFYRCNNRKMWQAKWLNKIAKGAVILYATTNFICMWGAWIILVIFFAGASKTGEDWSLGQALAITPWIPVLVEFISILCCKFNTAPLLVYRSHVKVGAEVGHTGRLPIQYTAMRRETVLHQQETDGFWNESATVHYTILENRPESSSFRIQYPLIS